MSKLRRINHHYGVYFITSVTFNRNPILIDNEKLLLASFEFVRTLYQIELKAWVILPDHFHLLIESNDVDVSDIMRRIKTKFSGLYRSQLKLTEGRLWQHRFWDHAIRDETDFRTHFDYIHYNPVKHGLVNNPFQYKHSSIHKYLKEGYYQPDWGVHDPVGTIEEFGE
jgi:putative transposase